MYKVKYYMGNYLVFKIFKTLSEAVDFSNKRVGLNQLYEIVKVKE